MPEQQDVKVFISWSGDLSKAVASVLHDWISLLSDRLQPWMSDSDIEAGQRGLAQIETELQGSRFGIIVVTSANQRAQWLNFEAGALSKVVSEAVEQRVVPLLVDLDSPAQLTGPLTQFQAKLLNEDGLRAIARSLANVAGVEAPAVFQRFDMSYMQYWQMLEDAMANARVETRPEPRDSTEMLEEVLTQIRAVRTLVSNAPSSQASAEMTAIDAAFPDNSYTSRITKWVEDAYPHVKLLDVKSEPRDDSDGGPAITMVVRVNAGTKQHDIDGLRAELDGAFAIPTDVRKALSRPKPFKVT